MRFGKKVVGSQLYKRLNEDVLCQINGTAVTRQMLIEKFKCGNFAAAKNLVRAAEKADVSLASLTTYAALEALAKEPGVGVTTLYVALCLMRPEHAKQALAELDVTLPTVVKRKEAR
jgi:hypothetical protein